MVSASSGVSASVMYRKSTRDTSSSGDRSANTCATGNPTTNGASERTAATVISLPRPTVNARPKPSRPALVRTVTYVAE